MPPAQNDDGKDNNVYPISTMDVLGLQELDAELTATQNRRVLLKIDLVVMPLIVIAMTLAFLDKVFDFLKSIPKPS